MGYQYHRHAGFALQVLHKAQHLRLRRHVERRRRFVRDQQVRLGHHRHRDHSPLPHPAGHLERVGAKGPLGIGESDPLKGFQHLRLRIAPGRTPVQPQDLADLIADPVQRRQRTHRLLKDHGYLVAADFAHLTFPDRT